MSKVIPKLQSYRMTGNCIDMPKLLSSRPLFKLPSAAQGYKAQSEPEDGVFTKHFTEFKESFTSKISFNACDMQNHLLPKESGFMQEYVEPMVCSEFLGVH